MKAADAFPATAEGDSARASGRRRWRWPALAVAALAAFAVTRVLPVALTLHPQLYGDSISDPAGDLARYAAWGGAMVGDGLVAYRDFDVEYPPGALPFVLMPAVLGRAQFSAGVFVTLLALVDLAGFIALLRLARRGGSPVGALTWLVLPPLLGVVLYGRLDLVPAVALLLALERAHAGRWAVGGLWLGLGTAAKLVPGLAVPLAAIAAAGRRWRLVGGTVLGVLIGWLPYAADSRQIWHDVVGYHATRGIHLESLWGSLLNLQRLAGGPVELLFERGAFGISGPAATQIVRWSTILNVAIVVLVCAIAWLRWRGQPRRARTELPLAVTAVLALLLGTARVFSPQFVVWLLAAAAVAVAVTPSLTRWVVPALAIVVVLTVLGYPLGFDLLRQGARWPAVVLVCRNLAVLGLGAGLVVRWTRGERRHERAARSRGLPSN